MQHYRAVQAWVRKFINVSGCDFSYSVFPSIESLEFFDPLKVGQKIPATFVG
jgi:hypothetical protein